MIKLFEASDNIFTSNGDKIILPLRAKVKKEQNGEFYLDLETDLSYINDLVANKILVAPTPQGEQAFRISDNIDKSKHKISLKAKHVYYDTENYLIEDSYVVDNTCNYALDHLNSATSDLSPFTTLSDVPGTNSFRCVRKSLYEAINVVLERWGGNLVRDNFNIQIRNTIGEDNGVVVRYAKNLKDITCEENWGEVTTKLLPVGRDGLLLPEKYVYSQTQYEIPYTKTISFNQDINEDDYKDESGVVDENAYQTALIEDLRKQGQLYVDANCIPKVNYTLKANLEKVSDIGDTIQVIDERLGISITTTLISYTYDCILGKYIELEFGNFKKTLSNLMGNISNQTHEIVNQNNQNLQIILSDELKDATDKIWGALGSSYVIYEGDKILVVDSLPKETATNVIMINNGGIGFSNSGINGQFKSAWTIDNVFNAEMVSVINFSANLIKGGVLKLGSNLNEYGTIEVYDEANSLIAELNKNGLKMYGVDGSYVLMNNEVGFSGYDRLGNQIYWVSKDEFHMKKSVVEEEITLCNKLRFIPITITDSNDNIVNDGIGLVSVGGDS